MDPYELNQSEWEQISSLYSGNENWRTNMYQYHTDILNWMLMIKENIDVDINTITLPDDTVVRYTGGCVLNKRDTPTRAINIYLFICNKCTQFSYSNIEGTM